MNAGHWAAVRHELAPTRRRISIVATVFDDSSSTTVMCHQAYAGPEPAWLGVSGERRMCLGNLHDRSGGHAESLIDVANVQISLQACIGLLANIPDGFQLKVSPTTMARFA